MSFSFREGKDEVHFMTAEDLDAYAAEEELSSAPRDDVHEQYPGAVSESGEINWDCPCLGGLGTEGPCVDEFRSAFSCWMFSSAEKEGGEKGDDCVDNFFAMSMCMQENETFYEELNARNKAEAAEAIAKYEEEDKEKLSAAEQEQKALESSAPEQLSITESETEIKTDETETKGAPTITYSSTNSEDFPKAEFTSNSVIVAAASDEPDSDVQGVEEQTSGES